MTRTSKLLCALYALIAIAALYGTWSQNLAYMSAPPAQFLLDLKANPATKSISIDIGWFLLAAAVFMVREARRVGVRFVWAYIVFAFLIAVSVTFPLFLIAREVRLSSGAPAAQPSRLIVTLDVIGLAIVTAIIAYLAIWLR